MSEQNASAEALSLPSPRSPASLDRKILQYADDRRPAVPRRSVWPLWSGALATASLAAFAVLFVVSSQQPPASGGAPVVADVEHRATTVLADRTPRGLSAASAVQAVTDAKDLDGQAQPGDAVETAVGTGQASADTRIGWQSTAAGGAAPLPASRREQLQRIAEQWRRGEASLARSSYQRLRDDCPACGLPQSLTEALARYPDSPRGE